jgi:hypothetical protein
MSPIIPGKPVGLAAGNYQFNAVLTSGTILMQMSTDGGTTFRTMTDGTISATADGIMRWGGGNIFKAVISGDGVLGLQPSDKA